jgi:hypothetical protein
MMTAGLEPLVKIIRSSDSLSQKTRNLRWHPGSHGLSEQVCQDAAGPGCDSPVDFRVPSPTWRLFKFTCKPEFVVSVSTVSLCSGPGYGIFFGPPGRDARARPTVTSDDVPVTRRTGFQVSAHGHVIWRYCRLGRAESRSMCRGFTVPAGP